MANQRPHPRYNKRVHQLIEALYNSSKTQLSQCYDSWSTDKDNAFDYCRTDCRKNHGYRFRILSHNGFMFTCAYLYDKISEYTGEIINTYLVYHSRPHDGDTGMTHSEVYDVTDYYTVYTEDEPIQYGNHWYPQMNVKH